MSKKKAYVIRHGQTQFNVEKRLTGHVDIPLTSDGESQARDAVAELPEDISEIYSSDSLRCRQTTDLLNAVKNLPVKYDSRLRERNFGSLEGKTWEEIDSTGELIKADLDLEYDYRPYGGESVADVRARVEECLGDIKKECEGNPLIVTSGGVVRILKHKQTGEIHAPVGNASAHEIDLEG